MKKIALCFLLASTACLGRNFEMTAQYRKGKLPDGKVGPLIESVEIMGNRVPCFVDYGNGSVHVHCYDHDARGNPRSRYRWDSSEGWNWPEALTGRERYARLIASVDGVRVKELPFGLFTECPVPLLSDLEDKRGPVTRRCSPRFSGPTTVVE